MTVAFLTSNPLLSMPTTLRGNEFNKKKDMCLEEKEANVTGKENGNDFFRQILDPTKSVTTDLTQLFFLWVSFCFCYIPLYAKATSRRQERGTTGKKDRETSITRK